MLDQFRSLSGSLPAKILLGLLVLSFGVWGIGDMLRSTGRNITVVSTGNTTITGDDFARDLHRETETIRRMLGDRYSPEVLKSLNLPQQVLQRLVNRRLLGLESDSLGLMPSDAEVARHIRSNPSFQDAGGNFDKAVFEAMLRNGNLRERINPGTSEKNYVEQLRQDMASDLLLGTLTGAVPVADISVSTVYNAQEEQRSVAVYRLTPSLVANVPPPGDTQMIAYYNEHKNEFTAPEYRSISYAIITPADAPPVTVSEEQLKAAYKDRIDDFKRPERRTVEQLLYASEDKAKAAEDLLKGGKSVADVAKQTEALNKDALSLGKVEHDAVLANAADAVFALPVGGYTDPVQSPFGWHIFHVSAIEPPSVDSFQDVRPQLEKDLKQRDTGEAQNKLTNKLDDALAGGATLQEAAGEMKLKLHSVGPVDHQGASPDGSKAKDVPDFDKFLDVAFKTDEKTESSLIAAKGGNYFILRVESVIPERLRSLDEVRGLAVANWQKEEREKHLAQLAKDIAAQFANSGREGAIARYTLQPVSGTLRHNSSALGNLSLPAQLVADAFRHRPPQSTDAYPIASGDYLIAVVTSVIAAPKPSNDPKLEGALADIRKNLKESKQNEILEQYTRYLAQKYPVSVNQAAIEAVLK